MKRLLACLLLPLAAVAQDWAPNLTTTATWEDNVSQSDRGEDRVGALALSAAILSVHRQKLGEHDTLRFAPQVDGTWTPRFARLDWLTGGATLGWRHAFGPDESYPSIGVDVSLARVFSREWRREGTTAGGVVELRQSLGPANRLALRAEVTNHDARASVFDAEERSGRLELSHDVDPSTRVVVTAGWSQGEILTYTTSPRPDLAALASHTATLTTFGAPVTAHSLRAHTKRASVAWMRALDETSAVVFRYEWRESARRPLVVHDQLLSMSVVHQF